MSAPPNGEVALEFILHDRTLSQRSGDNKVYGFVEFLDVSGGTLDHLVERLQAETEDASGAVAVLTTEVPPWGMRR
jgi:hypothetical protein